MIILLALAAGLYALAAYAVATTAANTNGSWNATYTDDFLQVLGQPVAIVQALLSGFKTLPALGNPNS